VQCPAWKLSLDTEHFLQKPGAVIRKPYFRIPMFV